MDSWYVPAVAMELVNRISSVLNTGLLPSLTLNANDLLSIDAGIGLRVTMICVVSQTSPEAVPSLFAARNTPHTETVSGPTTGAVQVKVSTYVEVESPPPVVATIGKACSSILTR